MYLKLCTILLLFTVCAKAQYPVARFLNTQNGLPSNTIYHIIQDSKGFIWLGHDKGLSRYDGINFKNYGAKSQQGKSVSNLVEYNGQVVCQDFSGNFYITNGNMIDKIDDLKSYGFYSVGGLSNKKTYSVINIDSIRTFNFTEKKRAAIPLLSNALQPAVLYNEQGCYFFDGNEFKLFDGEKVTTIEKYKYDVSDIFFIIKTDNALYGLRREGFPFILKFGVDKFEPINLLKEGQIANDVNVFDNEIWISTSSGAYCFNKLMQPKYNGVEFFPGTSISRVIKDKEGNYWFSTINKGVIMVNNIDSRLYKNGNEPIMALNNYQNNEILAATSSGDLFSFNKTDNKISTISSSLMKGEIGLLFYDSITKTTLTGSQKISYIKGDKTIYSVSDAPKSLAIIDDNCYAVASSSGITLRPRIPNTSIEKSWIFKYAYKELNTTYLRSKGRGRAVYFSVADSTLYSSNFEGLHFFNPKDSGTITFNGKPIYGSCITKINNEVYIGTFTDGLYKIINNNVSLVNELNTKLIKTIYKIKAQSNKYLWLIGDEIIQKVDLEKNTVLNYTTADGLPKAELKDFVIDEDFVYVATTDGLVLLDANASPLNSIKPKLYIDKILVNDKEVTTNQVLNLSPNENNVQLFLSLISFKDSKNSKIKYRINNGDWKELSEGQREIPLLSLASGTYDIELTAENEDGLAIDKNIFIKIKIKARFYQSFWFWLLITGLIIGGLYAYFRLRIKSEQASKELAEQKVKLERELHQSMLSSIKSQMNPHFLFNALNTIQSYIYTNDKENASLYLGKFSELTRMILDMSNKESVVLSDEIKTLKLYLELEQLRFENKLTYTMNVHDNVEVDVMRIPAMLIQPYVENAIKHGLMHQRKKWELNIAFERSNNGLNVIVDDNGIGREASALKNAAKNRNHTSFATNANEKRLEILNKGLAKGINLQIVDKIDTAGNAAGTTIILNIPIS